MPIWLRNYTGSRISEFNNKQKSDQTKKGDNATSTNIGDPMPEHMKKMFQNQSKKSSYTTQKAKK